ADYRCVQRAVEIVAGYRDPILKAFRDRRPRVVDNAEREITIFLVVRCDYPCGDEIVNLFDSELLFFELFPKRVETFYAALDRDERHLVGPQPFLYGFGAAVQGGLEFGPACIDLFGQPSVLGGMQILERKVLELRTHLTH